MPPLPTGLSWLKAWQALQCWTWLMRHWGRILAELLTLVESRLPPCWRDRPSEAWPLPTALCLGHLSQGLWPGS